MEQTKKGHINLISRAIFEICEIFADMGFAFGGGIDRLVMVKYDIPDVRMFYNGDLRLVDQF